MSSFRETSKSRKTTLSRKNNNQDFMILSDENIRDRLKIIFAEVLDPKYIIIKYSETIFQMQSLMEQHSDLANQHKQLIIDIEELSVEIGHINEVKKDIGEYLR
jgi:hypothetical protein